MYLFFKLLCLRFSKPLIRQKGITGNLITFKFFLKKLLLKFYEDLLSHIGNFFNQI